MRMDTLHDPGGPGATVEHHRAFPRGKESTEMTPKKRWIEAILAESAKPGVVLPWSRTAKAGRALTEQADGDSLPRDRTAAAAS